LKGWSRDRNNTVTSASSITVAYEARRTNIVVKLAYVKSDDVRFLVCENARIMCNVPYELLEGLLLLIGVLVAAESTCSVGTWRHAAVDMVRKGSVGTRWWDKPWIW
jgi:hypothetical protein